MPDSARPNALALCLFCVLCLSVSIYQQEQCYSTISHSDSPTNLSEKYGFIDFLEALYVVVSSLNMPLLAYTDNVKVQYDSVFSNPGFRESFPW